MLDEGRTSTPFVEAKSSPEKVQQAFSDDDDSEYYDDEEEYAYEESGFDWQHHFQAEPGWYPSGQANEGLGADELDDLCARLEKPSGLLDDFEGR
jgi:hypothetical protein